MTAPKFDTSLSYEVGPFPASLGETAEDKQLLIEHWYQQVAESGFLPANAPEVVQTVHSVEAASDDSTQGPEAEALAALFAAADGAEPPWKVVGKVRRIEPLPVFVPSAATVEQAAAVAYDRSTNGPGWDKLPPHIRNHYTNIALDMLSKTGHRIVVDSLRWLAEHKVDAAVELDTEVLNRVVQRLYVQLGDL